MKTKFLFPVVALCMGLTAVSCSDDNKDNPDEPTGEAVDLPIPSSVVDGVRVTEIQGTLSVDYNADGSINTATVGGQTFQFEYADSRAASTGRKLARIVAKDSGDGYSDSWQATNFRFNKDGFIVGYLEINEENYETFSEKTTLNVTVDYNSAGRITSMNISGTNSGVDEDGKYSYPVKGTIKYQYNGGALVSSTLQSPQASNTFTFDYAHPHTNTYNITTPQLAICMANYSPIAYVFAVTGYMGNASTELPTKLTQKYVDFEDADESETESWDISYTFNDRNAITSITSNILGSAYTSSITYINQ